MQPAKTPQQQAPIKKLGPDDVVVKKRATVPRNVDVDHANQVPDQNWEIGTAEDQVEEPAKNQAELGREGAQ